MRVVVQRVTEASVAVDGSTVGEISKGLLVLVGVEDEDGSEDIKYIASKIVNLRIFDDENGVMNRSVMDIGENVLLVSQFTLHASTAKGNRPSYIRASKGDVAEPMYKALGKEIESILGHRIEYGVFGADMKINLVNDGPVTIIIDSKNKTF